MNDKIEKHHDDQAFIAENTRSMTPVAIMEGCFPEKFGVPRQAGIVKSARGVVRFLAPFNHENYLHGLELSSHIWLTFGFHQNAWNGKATVRPQRLGGNDRMGVFATRSSFRPNGLGLSAVKIERIDWQKGEIEVSGHDLVDGTPIYCVKPYIPFADSLPEATSDFAVAKPEEYPVSFSDEAEMMLQALSIEYPDLRSLITEVIAQNPTPQFHQDEARIYGVALKSWNILFQRESAGSVQNADKIEMHQEDQANALLLKGFRVIEIKTRNE